MALVRKFYFHLRPFLPVPLRIALRKKMARRRVRESADTWPIDEAAGRTPSNWPGWPDGKRFAVVLTHDIESPVGLNQVRALAGLEESLGYRSSFNFVPKGSYPVAPELRRWLTERGFEVGIHDLYHDGKLYSSRTEFLRRAELINRFARDWNVVGFRSAFMLHNLDWLPALDVEYDASTFDTDPFEFQPDGVTTIFPFWVAGSSEALEPEKELPSGTAHTQGVRPSTNSHPRVDRQQGFVELPYTLVQDISLFMILGEKTTRIWEQKLDWIVERGGMALLNVHPDYIDFSGAVRHRSGSFSPHLYAGFLKHIRARYGDTFWHALPRDVARFTKQAYQGTGPRRPRHIAMLAYSCFEQDGRIRAYASSLAARGDTVDVLSIRDEDASKNNVPPIEGTRVFHVQSRRRDERRPLDYLLRILTYCWRAARLLNRLDRARRYDLVHAHNVPDFLVFAAMGPKLRGARTILDLHDLVPEFYQSKFRIRSNSPLLSALLWVERASCRFADHVIVSNHLWHEKVTQRSVSTEHSSSFPNRVDDRIFYPRPRTRHDDRLVVIFPGGLQRHQGVHVAVEAMATLVKYLPNAELQIVGDGPAKPELTALVQRLQLDQHVRFLPPVSLVDVPLLLADADVGIVPKLAEGFGNEAYSTKIMEFMATRLPVVASRTRIDEYYFGDGLVHFFQSGNPEDLARAVRETLVDATLREQLIARGLEYVRVNNWSRRSQDYLALVDGLLKPRAS